MRRNTLLVLGFIVLLPAISSANPDRKQMYRDLKRTITTRVKSIDDQSAKANLKTSPNLSFTRRVLASPGSDWGLKGVGETFNEKRSALTNVDFAQQNIQLLRRKMTAFRTESGKKPSLLQRFYLANVNRTLNKKERTLKKTRELLRQTSVIWPYQGAVTADATADQVKILEATLNDTPADQGVIASHLNQYVASKHGTQFRYLGLVK